MNTLIDAIEKTENVFIVCHVRPDGDCLGAGFAVMRVCEKLGKKVDFVCDSPLPAHYAFLPDGKKLNDEKFCGYDLAIAVDCADEFRMGKYGDVFFLGSCYDKRRSSYHEHEFRVRKHRKGRRKQHLRNTLQSV